MSGAVVITSEMDHLDQLGAKAFDGFLVRKDLVRKYSRQHPVPTYVVELLLGRAIGTPERAITTSWPCSTSCSSWWRWVLAW
jgi:predicted ATP-dependent Lon-type protease